MARLEKDAVPVFSPARLKRQVLGPSHRFALVFPPGFEDLGREEARALGLTELVDEEGALSDPSIFEWEGKLADLYRASLFLRIPSRIFLRLLNFHAGAREELFRKVYEFPWELWLSGKDKLKVDAHIEYSKISHEGKAAQTVLEALARRLRDCGVRAQESETEEPEALDRLVLRLSHNRGLLSLDCSGESLYMRGWRLEQGMAPLRENIASGILQALSWPGDYQAFFDGMGGSATFALEAAGLNAGLPACVEARAFPFKRWPSFQEKTYAWLYKQRLNDKKLLSVFSNDWHEGVTEKAKRNALRAGFLPLALKDAKIDQAALVQVETSGAGAPVFFMQEDFFTLEAPNLNKGRGLLLLNPPYGLRMENASGSLYPKLARRCEAAWQAWDCAILSPAESEPGLGASFKPLLRFKHGGLPMLLWFREALRDS